jgi:hypothetical protein
MSIIASFNAKSEPINAEFSLSNEQAQQTVLKIGVTPSKVSQLVNDIGYIRREDIGNLTTSTFIFEQSIASSEWNVIHNLDKYPSVMVVDSANNDVIPEIEYLDTNRIRIVFNGKFKGKAYLN